MPPSLRPRPTAAARALDTPERERLRALMRQVRAIEVRTRRLVTETLGGDYRSVFRGRGIDFDEVREYTPGDDVRFIDWNVTARAGKPFIKRFREERELTVVIAIDASASLGYGSGAVTKQECAAEVASLLALAAAANRDRAGLLLFTDRVEHYVPPRRGRAQTLRMVRDVLGFQPQGTGTDLEAPLQFVSDVLKRRAVVCLISDFCAPENKGAAQKKTGSFAEKTRLPGVPPPLPQPPPLPRGKNAPSTWDQAWAPLRTRIQRVAKRHDVIAMQVSDPRERELAGAGWTTFQDAETGRQLAIPTGYSWVRERYARAAREEQEALRRVMASAGVDWLELSTARPYLTDLARFFHNRVRRRK